jgi:hypothetical protein
MTYKISEYNVALNLFFKSKLQADDDIHHAVLSSDKRINIVAVYNKDLDILLSSEQPITEDLIKQTVEKVHHDLVKISAVTFL